MKPEEQQRIVLETLDRINRNLHSDPNALPDMTRPEASYLRMVDNLLNLCDLKLLKNINK